MFGKNKAITGLTYIAQGTRLTGETAFAGDALVGGQVYGKILSQGKLTIETDGLIDGEASCKELKVAGYFKGKLNCDKLIITGSGTVEGEVASKSMEIFEGGQFIGMRVKEGIMLLETSSPEGMPEAEPQLD